MASTGYKSPTATGSLYNQWTDPTNAYSSNDLYATESTESQKQSYNNFDFGIPATATIDAVDVQLEAKADINTAVIGGRISGDGGLSETQFGSQSITTTEAYRAVTGFDAWSGWTGDNFSNANFVFSVNANSLDSSIINLDHIKISVDYTEATTTSTSTSTSTSSTSSSTSTSTSISTSTSTSSTSSSTSTSTSVSTSTSTSTSSTSSSTSTSTSTSVSTSTSTSTSTSVSTSTSTSSTSSSTSTSSSSSTSTSVSLPFSPSIMRVARNVPKMHTYSGKPRLEVKR